MGLFSVWACVQVIPVRNARLKQSYTEINCHTINQFMFESSPLVDRVEDSLGRCRRCQDSACFLSLFQRQPQVINYLLTQDCGGADVRDAAQMTPSSRMQNPSPNQFSCSCIAIFETLSRFRRRLQYNPKQTHTQSKNQLHTQAVSYTGEQPAAQTSNHQLRPTAHLQKATNLSRRTRSWPRN